MKRILTLVLLIVISQLQAQQRKIDSLKNLLANAKNDSTRINLLTRLSYFIQETKTDLALTYAEEALKLAQTTNNEEGILDATGLISSAYTAGGNYSGALEKAYETLKKSEELKDQEHIAWSYGNIALAYNSQGDLERSLQYFFKIKEIAMQNKNQPLLENSLVDIGNCYRDMNKLDSARICINEALELSLRLKDNEGIGACYLNLGMIHTKMKLFDLAKNYLHVSLPYFDPSNHYFISSTQAALAAVFDSTAKIDSALYYNRESYRRATLMGSPDQILWPANQLVSIFNKTHQTDSALFYMTIVMQIKDSIKSMEKQTRIQSITFEEELKQLEKDKEKKQLLEDRKRNLQIAGVAVFLPLFFGFVLLLSRRQIKQRTVEILGVLFLLFVFEFITLYFHPIVGKWTNESPILMLLIFVAIAFILVPLHHRSETWIKKQLALQRTKELQKRIRMGEEAQKKLNQ